MAISDSTLPLIMRSRSSMPTSFVLGADDRDADDIDQGQGYFSFPYSTTSPMAPLPAGYFTVVRGRPGESQQVVGAGDLIEL